MATPDYFSRIAGQVNLELLRRRMVTVVGIGTVGTRLAEELARAGIGRLRLIDGDTLEEANRVRQIRSRAHVGMNKAEALAIILDEEIPLLQVEAVSHYVDERMPNTTLDAYLEDADLVVAATDRRPAQRRIAERCLALDVPAIFPALYGNTGGEVMVQLGPRLPCFHCWDGFRPGGDPLRGVDALSAESLPVIHTAFQLCLGLLDQGSEHRRMIVGRPDEPPRQLFQQERFSGLRMAAIRRRPDCPACRIGPARGGAQSATNVARTAPAVVTDLGGATAGVSRITLHDIGAAIAGGVIAVAEMIGGLIVAWVAVVGGGLAVIGAVTLACLLFIKILTGH